MGCHIYLYDKKGREVPIHWFRTKGPYDLDFKTPQAALEYVRGLAQEDWVTERGYEDLIQIEKSIIELGDQFGWMETG